MRVVLIFLLALLFVGPAYAYKKEGSTKAEKAMKAKAESVEIIEGVPKKKFQKIEPVWATASSIDMAIKKIKRQAARKGADAIIEFKMVTDKKETAFGGINSWFGYYGSGTQLQPVVQGWAVKWIN